jgi:endonuclease/exonuclease/phosphatase family metal-dependent hydrolase
MNFAPVLVTYNIRIGLDGPLAAVGDALAGLAPDVVCLQEVGVRWQMGEPVDQPAVLAARLGLPFVAFAGALTDARGGRFGVAILSRRAFRTTSFTLLPRAADEQRVLLQVVLDTTPALHVWTTHLSIFEAEREDQARRVREELARCPGPALLAGDFNDGPGSATLAILRGATLADGSPLVDVFDACGTGDPLTFSVRAPNRRIDYVLAGGGLGAGPTRVAREVTASDHFPVVTRVEATGVTLA